MPYQYQPYQPWGQFSPRNEPETNMIFVENEQEGRQFPVQPGCSRLIMNRNDPVFYLKTVDQNGFADFSICDFTVRPKQDDVLSSFTADEIKKLKEMLNEPTVQQQPEDSKQ